MNNAYLLPDPFPSASQIDACVKELTAKKFPQFELSYSPQHNVWTLTLPGQSTTLKLIFWIDNYPVEFDEEGNPEEEPCITFRQGHSYNILYWLQEEIFYQLQQTFGGQYFDDGNGSGEPIENEFKPCATYLEYLSWEHRYAIQRGAAYVASKIKEETENHLDWFPELKQLIGF